MEEVFQLAAIDIVELVRCDHFHRREEVGRVGLGRADADGSRVWVEVNASPIFDRAGAVTGMSLIKRDITGRKQDETKLLESEARLQLALNAATSGVWESTPATGEFWASEQATALFGLPAGTPLSHESALAAVHPDDRPLVETALRNIVETGAPFQVEMRALLPDLLKISRRLSVARLISRSWPNSGKP